MLVLGGLVLLVCALPTRASRGEPWSMAQVFVVALACGGFASAALPDASFAIVLVSAAVAVAVALHLSRTRPPVRQNRPELVVLAVLVGWITLRQLMVTGAPLGSVTRPAASLVLWVLVLAVGRRTVPLNPTFVARLLSLVLASVVLVGEVTGGQWRECRVDKCPPGGQIYDGIYSSENAVATLAVLSVVYSIAAADDRRRRLARIVVSGVLLVLAGSRTAQLSLVIGLALAALVAAFVPRSGATYRTSRGWAIVPAIAFPSISLLLIFSAESDSFSGRGRLWIGIREALGPLSLGGDGVSGWAVIQRSIGTSLFPHSEFGLVYVYGGLLGLALLAGFIYVACRRQRSSSRRDRLVATLPFFVFLTIWLTEAVWNPGVVDGQTWLTVMVVLSLTASTAGPAERPSDAIEASTVPPRLGVGSS